MEKHIFDNFYEGTTLYDLLQDYKLRCLVTNKNNLFGSTVTPTQLASVSFVSNVKYTKTSAECSNVEALPFLLSKNNICTNILEMSPYDDNIDYVVIKDIYTIDKNGKIVQIPINYTQMHDNHYFTNAIATQNDNLTLIDVYWYSKSMRENNISLFIKNCTNKNTFFYRCALQNIIDTSLYNSYLLYPQHGFNAIGEYIILTKASEDVCFCIDKSLKRLDIDDHLKSTFESKHMFDNTEIYCKNVIKNNLPTGKTYIRIVLTEYYKLSGNFKAYMESSNLVTIIGLNYLSKCVPNKYQLLYFIKGGSEVTDSEIKQFKINLKEVEMDISFTINLDLNKYADLINK